MLDKDFTFELFPLTKEYIWAVKELEIESGLSTWTTEDYVKEISRDDSIAYVAKSNDILTGFLIARLIMYENAKFSFNGKENILNEIEIYNIAVKKEFRRKGIGQAILNALVSQKREHKILNIWLEVRESNLPAISFYKKNGFIKTQIRKNFYRFPKENAVLMKLEVGKF